VDGDRDLDLVVSERFRKQRIGVFLNDGRGSFSKASSDLSSEAFRKTTWTSAVPNDSFQALDTKPPRRLDGDLERCGVISPQRVAFSAAAGVLLISIFDPGRGPHAIRAPPAICDVHSFTQND
jgi:hypothetical protein